MKNIFNKNKNCKNGVVVLKKTEPGMCGGTDATLDTKAPKRIDSEEMTFFQVESVLDDTPGDDDRIGFISAFAAPAGENTFVYLMTGEPFRRGKRRGSWALLKENIFPRLAALVNECDLAAKNGLHSTTHGLPENFGGSVDIRYASGERISFSDNQTRIITRAAGVKIAELFREAMSGERSPLPDISALKAISYEENRRGGGFTRATLTLLPDGTATNEKKSKYDDPTVYESVKLVDAGTVNAIKANIENTGILAWETLPANGYPFSKENSLEFVFEGGRTIKVMGDRVTPDQLSNGFFNILLEMTSKH